jgi:ABC-type uncharacterized transport system substrate-binding protein
VTRPFLHRTIALVCACILAFAAHAVSAQVLVVVSAESAVYQDAARELESRLAPLRDGRLRIDVVSTAEASALDERRQAGYELIVTVGLTAAQAIVANEHASLPPALCVLVPRQALDGLVRSGDSGRRVSAVFIEQPITRQLDLISLALPGKTRIGVVFGPASSALAQELAGEARERGLTLNPVDVADAAGLYAALQKILPTSDLLLALPDPVALNASTAHGVLVTSYRSQIPVIGFSQGMVDAGALVAVYSTSRQQGRQGAEIAARVLAGGELPPPQYPRYFTVAVNFFAARSLGLAMDDEATLAAALAERARNPRERPPAGGRGGVVQRRTP